MYNIFDTTTHTYLLNSDGSRVAVSEQTKILYEQLINLDLKFELTPVPDTSRLIATYEGGVNTND